MFTQLARFGVRGAAVAVVTTIVLGLATTASAAPTPVLYAAAGGTTASSLYTLDPTTGASTVVGPIGFAVTGMAQDPTSGILYGMTSSQDPTHPESLITINRATGAGTFVGSTGLAFSPADISFNASGQLYGWSEASDDLVTIDKTTGVATVVADSGQSTFGDGMSFSRDGTLYDMSQGDTGDLWKVDTATGQVTTVATLNGGPARDAAIAAASFACDGTTLYAIDNDFGTAPNYLVTVNTGSGAVTTIGDDGVARMDALEWYCPTEISISGSGTVDEGAGTKTFTVSRVGSAKGSVSVNYATADGTAKAGSDYTATSGTLTWADQDTANKTITVPIIDDNIDEPDETFSVNLSNPTSGATLGTASATATIVDNDAPPPSSTTGSASSITSTSATVGGTVNPNGFATSYHFDYGPTASYGKQTASASAGAGTAPVTVSAKVTGLLPGTTYHYRLVATSSGGTVVGADRTFTTTPRVSLRGAFNRCTRTAFLLRVSVGASVDLKSARVYLDGRRVNSTTKKVFAVGLNARQAGRHSIRVVIVPQQGASVTRTATFRRCAAPRVVARPRFTG